ncbi:hypothetical protein GCM10010331_26900 [Streptomyces xanthochromogenes]|uniref:hypothetical protein n=1 Tax=Streptomyces xanthochromogenes TaxID=67384 RepID=UPI001673FCE8|nr:hypothetical protein [Streptomyces xanthochromogenes]GHB38054.1 hypothetical protein GCM10010331_26900 [Streptomyces xanthochromogenes]
MVLVAVLLPNLMLVAVLALGRYEELVLGGNEPAAEPPGRHLVAVPDLPPAETAPHGEAEVPYDRATARRRLAA